MTPETRDAILTLSRRMDALADELRGEVANDAELRDVRETQLRAATEYTRELEAHLGIACELLADLSEVSAEDAWAVVVREWETRQKVAS